MSHVILRANARRIFSLFNGILRLWLRMTSFFLSFWGQNLQYLIGLSASSSAKASGWCICRKEKSLSKQKTYLLQKRKRYVFLYFDKFILSSERGRFYGKATETGRTLSFANNLHNSTLGWLNSLCSNNTRLWSLSSLQLLLTPLLRHFGFWVFSSFWSEQIGSSQCLMSFWGRMPEESSRFLMGSFAFGSGWRPFSCHSEGKTFSISSGYQHLLRLKPQDDVFAEKRKACPSKRHTSCITQSVCLLIFLRPPAKVPLLTSSRCVRADFVHYEQPE